MRYEPFLEMISRRRTPRLVDRGDIPQDDIDRIRDAIRYAPSFNKAYPYKVIFLTNSTDGIEKKERLVEHFRCLHADGTTPAVGDPWDEREMPQSLLGGLTIAYVLQKRDIPDTSAGPQEKNLSSHRDIAVSASYSMLAASSLGYVSGMFGACTDRKKAAEILTDELDPILVMVVAVARAIIPPIDTENVRQYFSYRGQNPYALWKKHRRYDLMPIDRIEVV